MKARKRLLAALLGAALALSLAACGSADQQETTPAESNAPVETTSGAVHSADDVPVSYTHLTLPTKA